MGQLATTLNLLTCGLFSCLPKLQQPLWIRLALVR